MMRSSSSSDHEAAEAVGETSLILTEVDLDFLISDRADDEDEDEE